MAVQAVTVLPFKRRTYEAKGQVVHASGMTLTAGGTLDGCIVFVVEASNGNRIIYEITRDNAVAIIAALHQVVHDIDTNCLFDRDPLLMPETAE